MIKEALEYLMGLSKPEAYALDGRNFASKSLVPIPDAEPETVHANTLTGLVQYIMTNPDNLDISTLVVQVDSVDKASLYGPLTGGFLQRPRYFDAELLETNSFRFGSFYDHESFLIAIQALFIQDETTAAILKLVGNLKDEKVEMRADDGITQSVTAKSGITRVSEVEVPNPVTLRPFRTFREIEQPASKFVFRMKSGLKDNDLPSCALFEADGGMWKFEAMYSIETFLIRTLPKGTVKAILA